MNRKGIISLEFILCVLIILMVLGFFIEINLKFKEEIEYLPKLSKRLEIIKNQYFKEKNWEKYEQTSTSYGG